MEAKQNMHDMVQKEYPYLYETHLHTLQGSACAHNTGAQMAKACKEYGYTGIIVTDHNWGGNTSVDRNLPWEEWVEQFFRGYEDAKAQGEQIGLDVFFGYEAGYRGTEFLIYGVGKEWMKRTPRLWEATVEEQYTLVHEAGGMVIHAHPFREAAYIPETRLYPGWVDGVEGINSAHSMLSSIGRCLPEFDERAIAYALEHGLPMSAGSDIHATKLFGGGVAFRRKLRSCEDYVQAVLGGEDYVMTDGKDWYDKDGRQIG